MYVYTPQALKEDWLFPGVVNIIHGEVVVHAFCVWTPLLLIPLELAQAALPGHLSSLLLVTSL